MLKQLAEKLSLSRRKFVTLGHELIIANNKLSFSKRRFRKSGYKQSGLCVLISRFWQILDTYYREWDMHKGNEHE